MSWLVSLVWELIRPRPHGASVLSGSMSTIEMSKQRRCLLGNNGLGVNETILLDGSNIGIGPQILELGRRESTSEAVDDVPLVGDRGGTIELTRECVDVGFTASTILEGDNVSSSDGFLSLLDLDEGRRSRKSRENAESEDDQVLGEHIDDTG